MASFRKFPCFVEDLARGVHILKTGTSHVLRVMLTNIAPSDAVAVKADLAEIDAGNGYLSGGMSIDPIAGGQTAGIFKLVGGAVPKWIASGGQIGPFQWAVLYNDTPTEPEDPVIGYWELASPITLVEGEKFAVDLDPTNGILTIA